MEFNSQQTEAIRRCVSWYEREKFIRPFMLTGYAGTGKTTIVQTLLHELKCMRPALIAPTGKAARVLSHKSGRLASTIHSILYRPISDQVNGMRRTLGALVEEQIARSKGTRSKVSDDFDGYVGDDQPYAYIPDESLEEQIEQTRLQISEFEKGEMGFDKANFANLRQMYDLLVVDEASMVDKRVGQDLLDTGIPLLLVFDPFQLPPVKSTSPWKTKPDVELTHIMRQGEGSGIPIAAQGVRNLQGLVPNDDLSLITIRRFEQKHYEALVKYDMVLCGTNANRRTLNRGMRNILGRPDEPVVGDKVIALANTRQVRNGELFVVKEMEQLNKNVAEMTLVDSMGTEVEVQAWLPLFKNDANTDDVPHGITPLTFGNCITVHKSQGSEAEKVLLLDDWKGSDYARWLYTGITRASKKCVVVRGS